MQVVYLWWEIWLLFVVINEIKVYIGMVYIKICFLVMIIKINLSMFGMICFSLNYL